MSTSPVDTAPAVSTLRFRDPEHQQAFERDGFLIGPDLSDADLQRLRRLWEEIAPAEVAGIWSNVHVLDPEINRRVDSAITGAFSGVAAEVLVNGRLAGASFLVKGTGPGSASEPHQDWNNVDERAAVSVSMWCPLVDVDEDNGALQVVPGTHRLRHTVRSLDTASLTLRFDDDAVARRLRAIRVPAGRSVFYAHNLFHGSRPNHGDRVRVAVTSGVLPEGVRHVHYRRSGPDSFDELEVTRDFFFSGIPELVSGVVPSSARVAGSLTVDGGPLTRAEVLGGADGSGEEPDPAGQEPARIAPHAGLGRRAWRRIRRSW